MNQAKMLAKAWKNITKVEVISLLKLFKIYTKIYCIEYFFKMFYTKRKRILAFLSRVQTPSCTIAPGFSLDAPRRILR